MMPFWKWLVSHQAEYDLSKSNPPALNHEELEDIKLPEIEFGKSHFHGSPELKKILANMYSVKEENVFIGGSASDTNDLVFDTLIRKGDKVLVESPVYPPLLESPKRRASLVGAEVVSFKRKAKDGFQIGLEEICKRIDKRTKLIVLTNLHNPSAVKVEEETIQELGRIAKKYGSLIMVDEVYRRYCPGLKSAYPTAKNALVTDSMNKYFGAASLKQGWVIADKGLVKALYAVQGYRSVTNAPFSEETTAALLPHKEIFDKRIKKHYDENFKVFEDWLKTRGDIELVKPDGKFCCFPKLTNVKNTSEFADHLYDRYGTLVVPGEFYGLAGHVRICFGISKEVLEKALANIGKALDDYGKKIR